MRGVSRRNKENGGSEHIVPGGESQTFAGEVPIPQVPLSCDVRSAYADGKFRPSSLSCDETNRQRHGA